jgi:hypothetical protein
MLKFNFTVGLRWKLGVGGGASGLDFSALTALPQSRESDVTTAAETTATALSITPQQVVDALGRANYWFDWRSSFTDTAGTVPAVQGNAIAAIKDYKSGFLLSSPNAAEQPTLGADGWVNDGTDFLSASNATAIPQGNSTRSIVASFDLASAVNGAHFYAMGTASEGEQVSILIAADLYRIGFFIGPSFSSEIVSTGKQIVSFTVNSSQIGDFRLNGVSRTTEDVSTIDTTGQALFWGASLLGGDQSSAKNYQFIVSPEENDIDILDTFVNAYDSLGVI